VERLISSSAAAHEPTSQVLDLARLGVRGVNAVLHRPLVESGSREVRIQNVCGEHNLAVGLTEPWEVHIEGHAGYYTGAMNQQASITVHGNVGWGVGENAMSGTIRVCGCASQSVGASAHGGLIVIDGDASSRCGISLKGADIVVAGSVGHASAFMAQAGRLVVCGDAGDALGDSLYEAVIYVRGRIGALGADAREEPLVDADLLQLAKLLAQAGFDHHPREFRRIASARSLYHWNSEHHQEY
jgi:methylamine---glutamate N-methyltransferase subunit B